MAICWQTDLHHKNSAREAKSTHSSGHCKRSRILPKNTSEGLVITFKDYMHYMLVQVTRMLCVCPQSQAHSVNTTRSEAFFICCFDWQKLYSIDVLEQLAPALKSWFSKQTGKQQKTKMKLKSKEKIYSFLIKHVTAVRSGPAGQSQGIFLLNPCHDEGMSTKRCHTGSKHYPCAAPSSLAGHTVQSKNSSIPDMKILNVLGKAWEKPFLHYQLPKNRHTF